MKMTYLDALLDLADDLFLLGNESVVVILARLKLLARADPIAFREATLIMSEKTKLCFDCYHAMMRQAPLLSPVSLSRQNVRYLRRKVAANNRRLQASGHG